MFIYVSFTTIKPIEKYPYLVKGVREQTFHLHIYHTTRKNYVSHYSRPMLLFIHTLPYCRTKHWHHLLLLSSTSSEKCSSSTRRENWHSGEEKSYATNVSLWDVATWIIHDRLIRMLSGSDERTVSQKRKINLQIWHLSQANQSAIRKQIINIYPSLSYQHWSFSLSWHKYASSRAEDHPYFM